MVVFCNLLCRLHTQSRIRTVGSDLTEQTAQAGLSSYGFCAIGAREHLGGSARARLKVVVTDRRSTGFDNHAVDRYQNKFCCPGV